MGFLSNLLKKQQQQIRENDNVIKLLVDSLLALILKACLLLNINCKWHTEVQWWEKENTCLLSVPRFYISGLKMQSNAGSSFIKITFKCWSAVWKTKNTHRLVSCSNNWQTLLVAVFSYMSLTSLWRNFGQLFWLTSLTSSLVVVDTALWRSHNTISVRLGSGCWLDHYSTMALCFFSHSVVDKLLCLGSLFWSYADIRGQTASH